MLIINEFMPEFPETHEQYPDMPDKGSICCSRGRPIRAYHLIDYLLVRECIDYVYWIFLEKMCIMYYQLPIKIELIDYDWLSIDWLNWGKLNEAVLKAIDIGHKSWKLRARHSSEINLYLKNHIMSNIKAFGNFWAVAFRMEAHGRYR